MRSSRGFSLVELLVALVLALAICLLVVPPLFRLAGGLRVDLAAHELSGLLRLARAEAIGRSAFVGVRFYPQDGFVEYALFRDGDGDGVRNADIASGVDRPLTPRRSLRHLDGDVGFGFPPGRMPRDPGDPRKRLQRREDPIRFNNSELASFGPLGTGTPGTVYVTDGRHHLVAVRVHNRAGRIRLMRWDARADAWR
jgi:prepilin-type N-terminal cleavage/methylation domain-containing protein